MVQPNQCDHRDGQNPKHQPPSTKKAPTSKLQSTKSDALWSLKFGASLELGDWSLELHFLVRSVSASALRKSRSTSANFFPTIDARATSTTSTGRTKSCWCNRNVSLSNRRARLRTTASPIFRLVITPTLLGNPAGRSAKLRIRHPQVKRWPLVRVRAKSLVLLMRLERGKRSRADGVSGIDYTGVRRLRPTRRRLARVALPLLLELRFKKPCCRLRRIFDG